VLSFPLVRRATRSRSFTKATLSWPEPIITTKWRQVLASRTINQIAVDDSKPELTGTAKNALVNPERETEKSPKATNVKPRDTTDGL